MTSVLRKAFAHFLLIPLIAFPSKLLGRIITDTMAFHPDSLPDLSGKVYIVTGGNSGIGYYTVARLAQRGAHVYLCARSLERGSTAIVNIKKLYPHAQISLLHIDHDSLASVASATKLFLSKEGALHGLVNNAGIMCTPFKMTEDGYEEQFQTNYLAHWLFTFHLIPLMLKTSKSNPPGSVRIVNLSSSGHYSAPKGGINFHDVSLTNGNPMSRYGQSKLANVLHSKTLNRLYGPGSPASLSGEGEIWTGIVHPGLVDTNLGAGGTFNPPIALKLVFAIYTAAGGRIDADKGSWTSVFCVASPAMKREQSGTYFQRKAEAGWQSSMAKDMVLAGRLEEWTKKEMSECLSEN